MGNSKLGKHEEEFESELDELISGISKIKNTSKLFSKGNVDSDSDDKEITDHSKEQNKLRRRSGRTIDRRQRCGSPWQRIFRVLVFRIKKLEHLQTY